MDEYGQCHFAPIRQDGHSQSSLLWDICREWKPTSNYPPLDISEARRTARWNDRRAVASRGTCTHADRSQRVPQRSVALGLFCHLLGRFLATAMSDSMATRATAFSRMTQSRTGTHFEAVLKMSKPQCQYWDKWRFESAWQSDANNARAKERGLTAWEWESVRGRCT